jgi:hypothetical protein
MQHTTGSIRGLVIGQPAPEPDGAFRVVVIDPDLNMVEAEDPAGTVHVDTIDHFLSSYPPP